MISLRRATRMVLADRERADARDMADRQAALLGPGIELRLRRAQILLRGAGADRHAGIAQAGQHVARQHEGVPAEEAQEILAAEAAQPRAALGEELHQADLIVGRPGREELAEAAVLVRDLEHELRVVAHRLDLAGVAHDALVGHQLFPELGGLEQQRLGIELEERFLEARPLLVDHVPHEARREDALGHLRQDPVVRQLRQRLLVGLLGQQARQHLGAALALFGAGADRFERDLRHYSSQPSKKSNTFALNSPCAIIEK